MKRLLVTVLFAALVASCSADAEPGAASARLGSTVTSDPVASPAVTEPAADADLAELVALVENSGAIGEWRRPDLGSTIAPAPNRGPFVEVVWDEFFGQSRDGLDKPNTILADRYFGDCDEACQTASRAKALEVIQRDPVPPAVRDEPCGLCDLVRHRSILEPDGDSLQGLHASELFDAFAPIDTDYEISLLFADTQFVANNADEWRVVTVRYADRLCEPTDLTYVLSSFTNDGAREQLATHHVPVEPGASVACASLGQPVRAGSA